MIFLVALLLGMVSGLRAMLPLAAVAWATRAGWLDFGDSWLALLGNAWAPWILTLLALGELVADKLPSTPSRTVPVQFGARLVVGAAAGALLALGTGAPWIGGLAAGLAGAIGGTLAGRALRARLASAFGRDLPAALLEDATAIAAAWLLLRAVA
ncbi:DUF4126 family protein [Luteimonas kalidii]|uniref:DUF4126 family protein n=1 Tax=Luteimonas kalidii TaxID=3042025 RepID=A0ABT6JQ62_9GAMM|nr:DUF4126 family protein [Luteimonas kalidii]MDH5832754.1 DUF4126 family protein [Luteimonas kalidii]